MDKEIQKWKVLGSKYLFKEPWLTVRAQKMELPNGIIIPSYYVLEYPSWVCTIAITKKGKMLMVKQYRAGAEKVLTELCAGVVDDTDKSPLEGAKRELMEETGYGKGEWKLFMTTSANPGTHSNFTYCFLATDVEKVSAPSPESSEDLAIELLEPSEVLSLLKEDKILQSIHAAALWKYFYLNR
ncbi:MAG: NUDIX hydrolase [Odoribacter sp.]|nr:NUDIX hydrolase [Odoribacter sp.]